MMFNAKLSKSFLTCLKVLVLFTMLLPLQGIHISFAQDGLPDPGGADVEEVKTLDANDLALSNLMDMGYHIDVATLENTIDTSTFTPPSPDPGGITYNPERNTLLISDSEVDEVAIYEGVNLYETTLLGTLVYTGTTSAVSNEPTGVTYKPNDRHLFFTDDISDEVFEMNPGNDLLYGTGDLNEMYTHFDTDAFGSGDPTGIAYNSGDDYLYVVDGTDQLVYEIDPQTNGFDGVDDIVTIINIAELGLVDPEGIEYHNPGCEVGNLFISDQTNVVIEMTTTGNVIRVIDISETDGIKVAGITLAPGSQDAEQLHFYIADRGIDNDVGPGHDPNENDGKVYEMSFPALTDCNQPPTVNAGNDASIVLPGTTSVALNGTVDDDLLPTAVVTTTWSQVSGPSMTVTFDDDSAVDTNAHFSEPGVYVLRLTADDGELAPYDEVTITVTGPGVTEYLVDRSSDDAEEYNPGTVWLTSTDLDLVYDTPNDRNQIVGIRFNGLDIPQGATIYNAYVQFQADESQSVETDLTIKGHDIDNSPTFTTAFGNISSRTKTSASVTWNPEPWVVGEASFDQRTPNIAPIIQEIVNRGGWSNCNSLALIFTGTGERVAESYEGDGTAPVLYIYTGVALENQAPCVDAGQDQTISMPESVNLDGFVSDDGKPSGALTTTWSQVGGTGVVTFGDVNALDTTASFSMADTYVLKLTAYDGELTSEDEVTITVNPVFPTLRLIKDGPATATLGETTVYTFTVNHDITSDGSPVSNIAVSDDIAGSASYVSGDDGDSLLEDGESWVFTASHTIQLTDPDPLYNTGTVTGLDGDGDLIMDSDIHSTAIEYNPVLTITKDGPDTAAVGETVMYTFTVSHDASSDASPVSSVAVSDDIAGTAAYVSGDDGDSLLEDGETWVFSASYTILPTDPNPLINMGSVTGLDNDGETITADDMHSTILGEVYIIYLPLIMR